MINTFEHDIDEFEDLYDNLATGITYCDLGVIVNIDQTIGDEIEDYETLKADKYPYATSVTINLISKKGSRSDVPYVNAMHGLPRKGDWVLVFYVGDDKQWFAMGLVPQLLLHFIDKGIYPRVRPGEELLQGVIREKPLETDEAKQGNYIRGGRVYTDFKGRVVIESQQNDGTINGAVVVTLGNSSNDDSQQFADMDPKTGKPIVFQIHANGVDINIDSDGNIHSKAVKDFIEEVVAKTIEATQIKLISDDITCGKKGEHSMGFGEVLVEKILSHTHPTSSPGAPTGPPVWTGGSPLTKSESVSTKVKLD